MQSSRLFHLLSRTPSLGYRASLGDSAADTATNASGKKASGDAAKRWIGRIRSKVASLLALENITLSVEEQSEGEQPGLRSLNYEFSTASRRKIRGTLLAPQSSERCPAVLVSAGRNAHLDCVTGAATPDYPDRNVAEHLARAGFATLTLDYGLDGGLDARSLEGRDEATVLAQSLSLCGSSLLGALVSDATAALAWLSSHEWVDGDRVGLFGHSLGGAVTLHTALVTPRPLPTCIASYFGSYPVLFGSKLSGHPGAILPGILQYADLPDLLGALAPAPVQIQYGLGDRFIDGEDAKGAADVVRDIYGDIGVADRAEVLALDMGHGTGIAQVVAFYQKALVEQPPAPAKQPMVPPVRIRFEDGAKAEALNRIEASLSTGILTQGPVVASFEKQAADWVGAGAVAVSSGASALEIAFRILGVEGKTVLTPVNTFFATAASAVRAGASVEFIDIEPDGLGMDPVGLERALDRLDNVAVVAPVHIGGIVSPTMPEVVAQCRRRGIAIVEDAAQGLGARLGDQLAGTFSDIAAFSFHPTKVATSCEGGVVSSSSEETLEEVRKYRDHGKLSLQVNLHDRLGTNWRMSEIHASVGIAHLQHLGEMLAARRELAAWYDEHLASIPRLRLHGMPEGVSSNYYKYIAYLPEGVDRKTFKTRVRERYGVALAGEVYDTLLCDQPFFANKAAGPGVFPHGYAFADRHICLPLYPTMTRAEQERVLVALRSELS